jgi:hypothetical protein
MKKIISLILVIIILFNCVGCDLFEPMEEHTKRYEVLSVYQYVHRETNVLGGISDESICYYFTYLSGNSLKTYEGFENLPYGFTHLRIGKKDEYVTNPDGEFLYLTKETLKNISNKE